MSATQRYRVQHAELIELVIQLASSVDDADLIQSPAEVREIISALAGKLSVHLAMEDKTLYPKLMVHSNLELRALSTRFAQEMGALADEFTRFNRRWLTADMIAKEPQVFVAQARQIIFALQTRIERENQELYVLIDELGY